MRIGLDLDGTIVLYDEAFHRHAVARFGLPSDVPRDKTHVRDWLRTNGPGEKGWVELQRIVYGLSMGEVAPSPGVAAFLDECHTLGVDVSIISHKTRYSVARPRVDLHAAAGAWLENCGLAYERVFFEPTRKAKLRRIATEGCVLFVDDLVEVLDEPAFPEAVERWLYSTAGFAPVPDGVRAFADWETILERVRVLNDDG